MSNARFVWIKQRAGDCQDAMWGVEEADRESGEWVPLSVEGVAGSVCVDMSEEVAGAERSV